MAWKLVPDSSADLRYSDFKPADGVTVKEVPLSVHVAGKEYIDDTTLDTSQLIKDIYNESTASTTSCPSPNMFKQAFEDKDADNIIAVTMSHKLSGTYNAAELAKRMVLEEFPDKNIHIVDSLSTCGQELLIVEKANELIKEGKDFQEIADELERYRDSLETLFTLSNYDNLIKNGRLSRISGLIAKTLSIRIVGMGDDGELKILNKVRGEAKAIAKLVDEMGKLKNMKGQNVIIGEVENMPGATAMMHLIEKKYPDVGSVRIFKTGGINSYYGEQGGLIVSF